MKSLIPLLIVILLFGCQSKTPPAGHPSKITRHPNQSACVPQDVLNHFMQTKFAFTDAKVIEQWQDTAGCHVNVSCHNSPDHRIVTASEFILWKEKEDWKFRLFRSVMSIDNSVK
jgi:hypothetical protein